MKRERQEGGSASKVAAFFKRNIYFVLMIVCVLAIGAIITVAAVTGSEDDPTDTPTITVPAKARKDVHPRRHTCRLHDRHRFFGRGAGV